MDVLFQRFIECLNIVDVIIKEGGADTIRVYLASMMASYDDVYDDVLNCQIHCGEKVKDLL